MVLGEGADLAVLDPAIHGRTKEGAVAQNPKATSKWKAAEAKARELGKSCITKDQMEIAQVMAGKVFAHPIAAKLLDAGTPEMSGYWHDDATGVRLRFRTDWLTEPMARSGRIICVDYKSAVSADPRHFAKQCADFGYHMQQAWYEDGLREVEVAESVGFVFIVQQKTPPFLVSVNAIPPEHVERGRLLNRRAIELYAECAETNTWPGYAPTIHAADFPIWAARAEEELLAQSA
jgi:hypothetical protein